MSLLDLAVYMILINKVNHFTLCYYKHQYVLDRYNIYWSTPQDGIH